MKSYIKYCAVFGILLLFLSSCQSESAISSTKIINHKGEIFKRVVYFIGGFIVGGLCIYLYSKWNIYTILSEEKNHYISKLKNSKRRSFFKYICLFRVLKESKDDKKKHIECLEKEISKIKNENKELKEKKVPTGRAEEKIDESERLDEDSPNKEIVFDKIENTESEKIYFTIPENDGSFKSQNGKSHREDNCFYKIVIKENNRNGELHFISGNYDARALDDIDNYLNPACEIENIAERINAKKITMTQPGTVILTEDSWMIDPQNKVKIRLI